MVSTTNEMRSSVYQEIQTNIHEKISQVNVMVQELQTKSNDVGQVNRVRFINYKTKTYYQGYQG